MKSWAKNIRCDMRQSAAGGRHHQPFAGTIRVWNIPVVLVADARYASGSVNTCGKIGTLQ
jgi:hypothetical protein